MYFNCMLSSTYTIHILNPVFYKKGAKNFVVAQNLQKLSLLSDGVRWDNFCKYRATTKF